MHGLMRVVIVVEISRVLDGLVVHVGLPLPGHLLVLWPRGTVILPRHVHHVPLDPWGVVGAAEPRRCERRPPLLPLHGHPALALRAQEAGGDALHGGALRHALGTRVVAGRARVHGGPVVALGHARARPGTGTWIVHVLRMGVVPLERGSGRRGAVVEGRWPAGKRKIRESSFAPKKINSPLAISSLLSVHAYLILTCIKIWKKQLFSESDYIHHTQQSRFQNRTVFQYRHTQNWTFAAIKEF